MKIRKYSGETDLLLLQNFNAQVRPDLRGGAFEREVLEETEALLLELMHKYEVTSEHIYADAFQEDTARIQILNELGWEPDNEAARGLYQSLGFTPWHLQDGFTKPTTK